MTKRVLVLNAGSSSLKYRLLDGVSGVPEASGSVERIGETSGTLTHTVDGQDHTEERRVADFDDALGSAIAAFERHGPPIGRDTLAAVGHRVVHGGRRFTEPVVVDDDVVSALRTLSPLAPLHNPANIEGIVRAQAAFPGIPHVAVFDTGFHRTLPPEERIPVELAILHQDEHLLVVDKPHFLPTTPGGTYIQESALVRLRNQLDLPDLIPMHRLDRMTAGILLLSTNPETRGKYQVLFEKRQVQKEYECVSAAEPAPGHPAVDFPVVVRNRMTKSRSYLLAELARAPIADATGWRAAQADAA